MFQDDAFFGYARAGSIDGHTQYPVVLDTERDVKVTGDTIEVLGGERFRVSFNAPLASTLSAGYQVSGDIVLLYSGYEGLQRPGRLMRVLREIRSKYGFSKLVYLQGPVDPLHRPPGAHIPRHIDIRRLQRKAGGHEWSEVHAAGQARGG
ncbi:hypothetical protein [Thermogymnomonas acidicola]|uniref:hypothetical protein n=1 Tax=Thermogymnomonas acidicola TaxID=399579 RepID=UPI00094628F7|nr:hypothetical protein [Thermogymnomonas acidicola]